MDLEDCTEQVLVEGAEQLAANGLYKRVDTHDNVGKYCLQDKNYSDNWYEFSLYRCDMADGAKQWCIMIAKCTIGGRSSQTMYYAPISNDDPDYPPSTGWSDKRAISSKLSVTVLFARTPYVLHTARVVKPVTATYESLLFSEEFSDIHFVCEGGVIIPAHKNILAASSPYFKTLFNGPWKENQSGLLNTSHPAHIVKETLSLIYTGDANSQLVREAPLAFISIASEFDLPWIKALAEPSCINSLDASNLKIFWQACRLYESDVLRTTCIDYAKNNSLVVLTGSTIIDLKSEDPTSWEEFVDAVGQASK